MINAFQSSGTSPTEIGPDFRCENHGSPGRGLFCLCGNSPTTPFGRRVL